MTYTIAVFPDDGQRNWPKHVESYSKNKYEKLVHLVGFITRIYHDARSPDRYVILSVTAITLLLISFIAKTFIPHSL